MMPLGKNRGGLCNSDLGQELGGCLGDDMLDIKYYMTLLGSALLGWHSGCWVFVLPRAGDLATGRLSVSPLFKTCKNII